MCQAEKVEYLSQMLADNAVQLHKLSAPDCTTIAAYACGDHYHIGHDGLTSEAREKAASCKAAHPFCRPYRTQARRRQRSSR